MTNPMKSTVKSCSCIQCRASKGQDLCAFRMKEEERSSRHQSKIDLKKGSEDIAPAHRGSRLG